MTKQNLIKITDWTQKKKYNIFLFNDYRYEYHNGFAYFTLRPFIISTILFTKKNIINYINITNIIKR